MQAGVHREAGLRGQQLPWEILLMVTVDVQRASTTAQAHFKPLLVLPLLTSHWPKQVTWLSLNLRTAHHKASHLAKPDITALKAYTLSHGSGWGRRVNVRTRIKQSLSSTTVLI